MKLEHSNPNFATLLNRLLLCTLLTPINGFFLVDRCCKSQSRTNGVRNKGRSTILSALFGDRKRIDRVPDTFDDKSSVAISNSGTGLLVVSAAWLPIEIHARIVRFYSDRFLFLYVSFFKQWEVYVDQSKASLEKGGSATLDAFIGLAPSSTVQVKPAILPKSKFKGPSVRCIARQSGKASFDVGNVDAVDKVYRILTKHMQIKVRVGIQDSEKD
jgi:hypothetical protein